MNQQRDNTSNPSKDTVRQMLVATILGGMALAGFYFWLNSRELPEKSAAVLFPIERSAVPKAIPDTAPSEAPAEVTTPPEPVADLPAHPIVSVPGSLEGSDKQVKLAIADLAPAMAEWLLPDQQIRKWVLSIDLMAEGQVPKQYRPLSFPITRFEPEVQGTEPGVQYFMQPKSFSRADVLVSAFVAIDPALLVKYYQTWLPLLNKAYQEQGKNEKFDQRFRMALQNVIAVKPLSVTPALSKKSGVIYTYADSHLESASDVEKMMWRLGPDNSTKIQNYLQKIQASLPRQ